MSVVLHSAAAASELRDQADAYMKRIMHKNDPLHDEEHE